MHYLWPKLRTGALFMSDLILLYSSLIAALLIRYGFFNSTLWQGHWPIFSGLFIFWVVIFYAFNLYDSPFSQQKTDFIFNYIKALTFNIILAVIYFYLLSPKINIAPKTILLLQLIIFSFCFIIVRKLIFSISNIEKFSPNLLLIGYDPLICELLPDKNNSNRFGYNFKGLVNGEIIGNTAIPQYKFFELKEVIKKEKIDMLVINEPENKEIINLLFQTLPLRINFTSLINFYEQVCQKIPLKIINCGWFLNNFSEGNKNGFEFVKRLFDIIMAILIGLPSLLISPLIILAIALDTKGKIIFKQIRQGKDGKPFLALKFRTMFKNAEQNGPMWAKENDPRVTKAGHFLRKTRLDEIPQLYNILRGEMSFVGPRPERPEFIEDLIKEIPFYKERLLVKPGLTGWAQIKMPYADSVESSLKKLQFDLYYVKRRSFLFDLSIILKTINIIIKKLGR